MKFRLFVRKNVVVPTAAGWLLILALFVAFFWFTLQSIYPFLSRTKKTVSDLLVVEGWLPDNGLREAIDYYRANGYKRMIITGIPITQWTYTSPHTNMADASAETMRRMLFRDSIYTVSIPSNIYRDRTYATAVALKMRFEEWGFPSNQPFDLYSMGAHARRSYNMFRKAFPDTPIGLLVATDMSFDPETWYKTSRGFRTVFSEWISYWYTALAFFPNEAEFRQRIILGRYADEIITHRLKKDNDLANPEKSPFKAEQIPLFEGLAYYYPDISFRVSALFEIDTTGQPFRMPTTTSRLPLYRKYGRLIFNIGDTSLVLTAFQNLDYLAANPGYNKLFIPFKDYTNGEETYGGGRYLDIDIPLSDTLSLDFNYAYNPYCAYSERWSCPIPPDENSLTVYIMAGEKNFPLK
ncbi:MAG: DUF1684 domain-containing protein [Bacteroidia bacterium]|nr:DUF1684 domain-containing protein [Bacteroidia bacterium]